MAHKRFRKCSDLAGKLLSGVLENWLLRRGDRLKPRCSQPEVGL